MIIYLTARPDRGPGLRLGLRPTRAYAPTWTCTVAEIARAIPPSPGDFRFSSSLRVQASRRSEIAFPIVGSRRQGLRPAPTFFRLQALKHLPCGRLGLHRKRCQEVPHQAVRVNGFRLPIAQRDHQPNSHDELGRNVVRVLLYPRSGVPSTGKGWTARDSGMVRGPGFEPGTSRLSAECSSRLSYPRIKRPPPLRKRPAWS